MIKEFPQIWQDQLETSQMTTLTDIQESVFEPIHSGKNVLGISPTGTYCHWHQA